MLSFLLVGLVSIAGKRGSAPTLVLSRAAFGRVGNGLPGVVSYLLLVGWETVLVSLATLRHRDRLRPARLGRRRPHQGRRVRGRGRGDRGRRGARLRRDHADPEVADDRDDRRHRSSTSRSPSTTSTSTPAGRAAGRPTSAVIGATVLVLTGFGVGLGQLRGRLLPLPAPHRLARRGVVFWPTFGGSLPVVILVAYGVLLCAARRQALRRPIAARPDRRADHDPADVVPGAVRAGRGRRPGQRRDPRHLLLRPDPAHPRPASAAVGGRRDRRRADDPRHDLHRLGRRRLPDGVHGVPDHPGRADGRLVRHLPVRPVLRRYPYDERDAVQQHRRRRRLRRGPLGVGAAAGRRHRRRLGPGHRHHRRRQGPGLARLPARARSASAAATATGPTPTSACRWRWSSASSATWCSGRAPCAARSTSRSSPGCAPSTRAPPAPPARQPPAAPAPSTDSTTSTTSTGSTTSTAEAAED